MFIDYVTLMLLNVMIGLFLLGALVLKGIDSENRRQWAPGFLVVGLVALLCGLHMAWTWPLPGAYNSAYGELSALFGAIFLGAGMALWKDWRLTSLAPYALFGGLVSILIGIRIINLGMTNAPVLSGIGFILTGLGGVLFVPLALWTKKPIVRWTLALALFAAGAIWLFTSLMAYWGHMKRFEKYTPPTMQKPAAESPGPQEE